MAREPRSRRSRALVAVRWWLRAASLAACTAVGGLLVWATAPTLLGWQAHVVMTGSMAPQIREGDVVLTSPGGDPQEGQVVVYRAEGTGRSVVHRVDQLRDDGALVTKGDANATADSAAVPPAAVEGIARLRVPLVGSAVVWSQQGRTGLVVGTAVLAVVALSLALGAPEARTPQHRAA